MIDWIKQRKEELFWLALIGVFMVTGLVGHDPWWKKGEAYSFGIIYHFYKTGTWLIPVNAGIPFMEKPPLYYWTATILCHVFDKLLRLDDAARLTTGLYNALTALFIWKTAGVLFETRADSKAMQKLSVLLFLATYGISIAGHALITDIALMAGTSIALYGLALLYVHPQENKAGVWLGIGVGCTFLAKGVVLPGILGASALLVLWAAEGVGWRDVKKQVWIAGLVALPFFVLWPALVYHESPELFRQWFWDNNIGRFFGGSVAQLGAENRRCNFAVMLPIFCFPILPLACATLILERKAWRKTELLLPGAISLVGLVILFASASFRTIYFLPLLPGFAVLAAQAAMRLPPAFLGVWNRVMCVAFTLFALGTWCVWWNLRYPPEHRPLEWLVLRFHKVLPPDFVAPAHQWGACIVALAVMGAWLRVMRAPERTPLGAARLFFAGAALAWCTTHSLLLPWINNVKSFRPVAEQLQQFLKQPQYAGKCIGNYRLGENMGPMLQYMHEMDKPFPIVGLDGKPCPLVITFALKTEPENIDPHWKLIWRGTRLLDIRSNELRLYEYIKE